MKMTGLILHSGNWRPKTETDVFVVLSCLKGKNLWRNVSSIIWNSWKIYIGCINIAIKCERILNKWKLCVCSLRKKSMSYGLRCFFNDYLFNMGRRCSTKKRRWIWCNAWEITLRKWKDMNSQNTKKKYPHATLHITYTGI